MIVKILRVFVVSVASVRGWGPWAHRLTSELACSKLNPGAADWVRSVLDSVDICDSMKAVSTWADEQPETGAYHFVNSNRNCGPYNEATDCGNPKSTNPRCLVTGLTKYVGMAVSESSSTEDLQVALKMIIHLMADLHQPMHLGFAEDHGGNDIYLAFPSGLSLHEVWDGFLTAELHADEILQMYTSTAPPVVDVLDPSSVHEYIAGIVSSVSSTYTCPVAYKDKGAWIVALTKLSKEYLTSRRESAKALIFTAGMRLGVVLNRIGKIWANRNWDPNPPAPIDADSVDTTPAEPDGYNILEMDEVDMNVKVDNPETGSGELGVIVPPRHVVDDVDISRVILLPDPYGFGVPLVTYRGQNPLDIAQQRILTFVDTKGKEFRIMFDMDILPGDLEKRPELYEAILTKVEGVARRKGDSKVQSEKIIPFTGTYTVKPNYEGKFSLFEVNRPDGFKYTTLLGDTLIVEKGYFRADAATHEKYTKRREVFAKLGEMRHPAPESLTEAEKLDSYALDTIHRKCGSMVSVSVDGFTLYALRSSLVGSDVRPLTVIAYNIQRRVGGFVAFAVDAKLLEIPVTSIDVQRSLGACFAGLFAEKPLTFNDYERPTLKTEIKDIYALIRSKEPSTRTIRSLVTYIHPSCVSYGGVVLEWTVRSTV
jgi:hypothetical protein